MQKILLLQYFYRHSDIRVIRGNQTRLTKIFCRESGAQHWMTGIIITNKYEEFGRIS